MYGRSPNYKDSQNNILGSKRQQPQYNQDSQYDNNFPNYDNSMYDNQTAVHGAYKNDLAWVNRQGTMLSKVKEPVPHFKHPTYEVTFRVPYETKMGESIAVLGSIEKLGLWKDIRYHLEWTEGHIWVSKEPLVVDCCYFQYKYVLVEKG